ncbi:MAG: hypothetical protein UR39_C0012G0006 [Candidatus Woesebacteria bacterium GW2011_GWA1_33_30]|uniref:Uncharacterized protein n=1 Tax=Candidatus Woesebacteria bacterium GW2011_GWA2_33_28 TaxID=1618561 RepID=A0A0F9ZQA5_9BACT|nr:MAG: hypothetical protein UR38_C0012G0006 [Candidatus Woesebacteria bacterium GW2011_GWA2_33_28]KKP46925.1 MAG: hypothetical protein UR39_C0012G0006 [Candidatus Woesebacteria bacterium GW2011_GWA1_33_30]KKP48655.1 MAG: hypothetical protein UR40_C0013G0006 [Microgenomates group bacterium GW2011_GWC1_33_32]KKP51344.1 MAG: hypothetical protein UR44_C0012G0006 [Candidatus Woesebacteria bacterium GW2011_GWB1_33_38]
MNKLVILILSLISVFILISAILSNSYVSLLFLPIPCYFIATLITEGSEFDLDSSKKTGIFYLGLIIILVLISIAKII